MADLFSIASEEAQGRRLQMLRTAFGPAIAAALDDPHVIEVMVNPDGRQCRRRRLQPQPRKRAEHHIRQRLKIVEQQREEADVEHFPDQLRRDVVLTIQRPKQTRQHDVQPDQHGRQKRHIPRQQPEPAAAPALTDLLGGQVQVLFEALPPSIEHIKAGTLRGLAVTTAGRSPVLPDVPTVGEFVPGYEASGWNGILAPKNTPADIVARLNAVVNAGLAEPRIKTRLAGLGATMLPGSPADFGKLIASETDKWGKVIRSARIKAE